MQRIRIALVSLFITFSVLILSTPAFAKSSIIIEPGAALRVGNNIECTQFVSTRDGAVIDNFGVEPRIEQKRVTKQQRRWIADRWVRDDFPIWNSRRLEKGHWYYPPEKVEWIPVGGYAKTTDPGKEFRIYARINPNPKVVYNAKPAVWDAHDKRYEGFKWKYSRPNPPGQQTVRCVAFFSGKGQDNTGTQYRFATTKIGGERRF